MVVNHRHRFVFVHVPKTGGTSLRKALAKLRGREKSAESDLTRHEPVRDFLRAYPGRTGRDPADLGGYTFVAFVRSPWCRFASLHRYLLQHHADRYPEVPQDLNDFAALLDDPPSWMAGLHSIRPQSDFIAGCDPWLGRYETLEACCERLQRFLRVRFRLRHMNQTAPQGYDWRRNFAPASVDAVARAYWADIERFGYEF